METVRKSTISEVDPVIARFRLSHLAGGAMFVAQNLGIGVLWALYRWFARGSRFGDSTADLLFQSLKKSDYPEPVVPVMDRFRLSHLAGGRCV